MSGLSITKYFPFTRMKIIKQNVHHEDASSALIYIEPDMRYSPLCHECGSKAATVHSKNHIRLIRDLNMANAQVFLQVRDRKIWCNNCRGVRVEWMSFADAGQRVTNRLARYIHGLCKMLTVKDVAEHLDIDHPAVRAFARQLRYFEYGIINHADYPIGTSMLEGINNKINVIKRKAYGFHDDRYFILKVKQAYAA